jgi:hypothetical protein
LRPADAVVEAPGNANGKQATVAAELISVHALRRAV